MIIIRLGKMRRSDMYWGLTVFLILSLAVALAGLDWLDEKELAAIPGQPSTAPTGDVSLVVTIPERILTVYSDGQPYKQYRVAVGKDSTPTPVGEWKVVWKDYNWGTGFGSRWMGLNVPWGIYGIHGTNKPWSIGRYASHGCIRMRNRDVEELFEWVPIGTSVKIVGRPVRIGRQLKYQMTGADVVVLQLRLKELGYLQSRADGLFGLDTDTALRAFQAASGLEATGITDKPTIQLLGL
jgi:murein L,D-transpeptidase YcbB/YkuD